MSRCVGSVLSIASCVFTSEGRLIAFTLVGSSLLLIAFRCFETFWDVTLASDLMFVVSVLDVKYVFVCGARLCSVEVVDT